jgi:ferredoxin
MHDEKDGWLRRSKKKDPLALLGVAVIAIGILLLIYGAIPLQRVNYKVVSQGSVPVEDPSNNDSFIADPESYYAAHSPIPLDKVECTPDRICYGLQFNGTTTYHSMPSIYYGSASAGLGLVALIVARRVEPVEDTTVHLRPIRIRVDEDICVANGVCIAIAPNVFQFRSQETPTIFAPMAYVLDPTGADNDTIIEAARMCPTGAIIIEDAETGERIHPPLPKS